MTGCRHSWSVTIGESGIAHRSCVLCGAAKEEITVRQKTCASQQSHASLSENVRLLECELQELREHIDSVKKYRMRARMIEKALKILRSL